MIKRLWRIVEGERELRAGPEHARRFHRDNLARLPTITAAIEALEARWPESHDQAPEDSPAFLLCAGWRSGSTLLQRLAVASRQILVWGEPYAFTGTVQRLAASLVGFPVGHPPDGFFIESLPPGEKLEDRFIANLYPGFEYFRAAHRQFFRTAFADPAQRLGYSRWGLKEVRLDVEHARYLRWLFPNSRIVFLYRNPYEAYRSYRHTRTWYNSWPDDPVMTPKRFGQLWAKLVSGYLKEAGNMGAMMVSYEELCANVAAQEKLQVHLGVTHLGAALETRIRGPLPEHNEGEDTSVVPVRELKVLKREVEDVASRLGYES